MVCIVQDMVEARVVTGLVKWFDSVKGFGFVIDDAGGPDVLLHANVLRGFGRSSIADGARVALLVQTTARGLQAIEVTHIDSPAPETASEQRPLLDIPDAGNAPLVAARMKWFDKAKGFGFANVFGESGDVFVHVEVLRQGGFADLQPGEAVAMRVVEGPRGRMAAEVRVWDEA